MEPWSFSIGACVLCAAFSLHWFSQALWQEVPRTDLDPWVAAYVVLFLLSVAFSKVHYLSCLELFKLGVVLCAFWAVRYLCRERWQIYRLSESLVLLGGLLSAAGLLQLVGGLPNDWWSRAHFLSSTYVNHNHFAGLLDLLLPVSLGLVLAERDRSKKILFLFLSVLMGVAMVFTLSRGAMVSLTVSMLFMLWILKKRKLISSGAVPLVLFIILVVGAVLLVGTATIQTRMDSIQKMSEEEVMSVNFRWWTWQGTFPMIRRYFWLGSGPGTFAHLFLQFRLPETSSMRPVYAHNDFLHLWAECGVFVFLAMAGMTVAFFRSGLQIVKYDDSRLRVGVGSGVMAGLLGLLVHGLFDFNFHIPANWLLAAVAAGLLFAMDDKLQYRSRTVTWPLKTLVSLMIPAIFAGIFYFGVSDYHLWEGRKLYKEGERADAMEAVEKSMHLNPWNAEAHYLRGLFRPSGESRESVEDFDEATRLNPYEPVYDMAKAHELAPVLAVKAPGELVALLKQGIGKDPNNQSLAFAAAKEAFGRDGAQFLQLRKLAGQMLEADRATLRGLVTYLEKSGHWQYHRGYNLKLHGLDPDSLKASGPAGVWDRPSEWVLTLDDFSSASKVKAAQGELFFKSDELLKKIKVFHPLVRLVVKGKGDPARGIYPVLYVKIDGTLADEYYMDSSTYKNYYTDLKLTPGDHLLGLQYVNDVRLGSVSNEDRNAYIKQVELKNAS